MVHPIYRSRLAAILVALILTSCASRPASPTIDPTTLPTTVPSVAMPTVPSTASATAEPPTEPSAVPIPEATAIVAIAPTPVAPSAAPGIPVLQLSPGAADNQVGIEQNGATLIGPNAFRIGSDGSIRILDRLKKRVLFFEATGKPSRSVQITEAQQPQDFIVNNAGETFIFDQGGQQILRYSTKGKLTSQFPIEPSVSDAADSIMLNATQDLVLMQQNHSFWVVLFKGTPVPPDQQVASKHDGSITPRSPMIFTNVVSDGQMLNQQIFPLASLSDPLPDSPDTRIIQVPIEAQFFNIDRAMNLYYTRTDSAQSAVEIWRVLPDGSVAGSTQISTQGCTGTWRSLYVDQVGAAWNMCLSATGVQIVRYPMIAADGTLLADADKNAASVPWRPGARLDAA